MTTHVAIVPFDLFGSPGAGAGAQLVADALREMLDDNALETQPTRARAYQDFVRLEEFEFETMKDYAGWHRLARQLARRALKRGEFLLWIGGNHMSVLPVLEELSRKRDTVVVQFDAHLDVYDLADCTTEPSHGNFLRHADGPLPPIIHVGHRDLFLPDETVREFFREAIPAEKLGEVASVQRLQRHVENQRLWIDIDCDVIDSAFFPAVDGPLPFGLAPPQLLRLIDAIWSERVIGVSISEFVPAKDRGDQSLGLLVWLIEWLLLKRYENGIKEG